VIRFREKLARRAKTGVRAASSCFISLQQRDFQSLERQIVQPKD